MFAGATPSDLMIAARCAWHTALNAISRKSKRIHVLFITSYPA